MPSCDAAMSDAVLQAARAAMPANLASQFADPSVLTVVGEKNRPLVPLLMALLDAATAVAKAIEDNAWDDHLPIPRELANALANDSYRLGATCISAAQPMEPGWSLPSFTGKELV